MFRFNKDAFYRNADTDGSGGGDDTTNTDTTQTAEEIAAAALQAKIDAAVEAAVSGLKKKNDELIGKDKRQRDELAALKGKPSLTDEEYTEFKTLKEKIERDEFLRLFTEGKSDEVIERVTKKTRLDAEARVAAEAEARARASTEATEWKTRYEQTLVSVEVAKATASGAVKPQYNDLVGKLVAERVKLVDGNVRVVNADGEIEMTANGAKPLTVADYIETLRTTYSDLFVASSGGGSGGSQRKPGGHSNKISLDAAQNLSMEEYTRLRLEGKI